MCKIEAASFDIRLLAPVRILFPFVGDLIGGSHLSTLELVQGLERETYQPLVSVHRSGALRDYLAQLHISPIQLATYWFGQEHHTISRANHYFKSTSDVLKLAYFLRKHHIQIVHTNDKQIHAIWGKAAQIAGVKHVLHLRGVFPTVYSGLRLNSLRGRLFIRRPDHVLTISQFCWDSMPEIWKTRGTLIPNPFHTNAPPPDRAKARQHLLKCLKSSDSESRIVGFVSNLINWKRPEIFIEMAHILNLLQPEKCLFPMFGDLREPLTLRLRDQIKQKHLEDRCILMGARFPIETWLAGMDVLVAPALQEPFGRTLIEAMLVGTPVVASNSGGHLEIIQPLENGLLAKTDDPQSFANHVMMILADRGLAKKISKTALQWAKNTFSIEQHVGQVQQVYRKLLNR